MAMSLGIGIGLPFGGAPAASAAVAGASATVFGTTPDVHYHPNSQSGGAGYTKDGDQVTACPSLGSVAAAMSGISAALATVGPYETTDALGRKFWRFNRAEYATIANDLAAVANRAFTVVFVGRAHHQRNTLQFFNPRFAAYTNPTTNTAANSSIGFLRGTVTSQSAPFLQGGNPAGSSNATDCYKIIPGCQLQVMGIASRTTANGGTRLYMNGDTCDVAQQTTSVTGYIGGIIAGNAGASNTENVTTSVNNTFDVYEIALWKGELSNTTADALIAAAVANYGVIPLTRQIVLEGDSITDGVATTLSVSPAWSGGIGTQLSDPGAGYVSAATRVISIGTSGATVSSTVTRRDATNSVFASGKYPGGASNNIVALQIGRNNVITAGPGSGGVPATIYAEIVAVWNTVTTGYLQRGWSGAQIGNIAGPNTSISGSPPDAPATIQGRIEGLRALMFTGTAANSTFLTDTLTNTGQTYDGLLACIPVHEITVSSDTAFNTTADASDTAAGYYDSDLTHLRVAGIDLMISGGDNTAYGYGAAA